ncbi:cyclodeaminase [Geminicoccaceae bacterium 1502E]|nr:cyclodeaminase [Geminicoccaceae bacterium 1502E]
MQIRVVDEQTLRARVTLERSAMAAVEQGFAALERGGVVMPPVLHMDIPGRNAEMDVKTAWVPGLPAFALKVSTGFFENAAKGLPSLSGMMAVICAETGRVLAVLLDNGWLTDLRTALAGAIAADRLARRDARTAGILGSGLQARLQLEALRLARPIERALLWGRDAAATKAAASELAGRLGIPVEAAPLERVVREAEILVTATSAREPLVRAEWLHPGLHVTAMGSDAPGKQELEPSVVMRADRVVVDRLAQCERLGELRAALEAGMEVEPGRVVELGAVIVGAAPGRTGEEQVTVCDLTGTGVQDTAIALHALRLVEQR